MRAALVLCCTLGVDSSFPQVLGGLVCYFLKNSFIYSFIYWSIVLYTAVSISAVQQSESVIYLSMYVSPSLLDFLPIFTTEH